MYQERHEEFVFTFGADPKTPVFPDAITRFLGTFSKRHGLPHITPHMLRRTLPTLLITKYKVDPKTLQAILGHSNISTTLGYYTMVSEDQTRKTLEMYSEITKKPESQKSEKREESEGNDIKYLYPEGVTHLIARY